MILRLLVIGLLLLASPLRAQDAGCATLLDSGATEQAIGADGIPAVQAGLRAVFGAEIAGLSDGIIGPVSRAHLKRLCEAVPLAEGTDPVAGTVALAREYAALAALLPDWSARIGEAGLVSEGGGIAAARRLLHLAGPPGLKRLALAGATGGVAACGALADTGPTLGEAERAELQTGLVAILEAERGGPATAAIRAETDVGPATREGLAEVCQLYPAGVEPALLVDAVRRFGRIVAAEPGAAAILRTPAFAAWLAEAQAERLLRFVGTPQAVIALLRDSGVVAEAEASPPRACAPREMAGPVYFAFTAADRERLSARTAIAEALAPVAEGRFADRQALVAAINAAIGVDSASCTSLIADRLTARLEAESQVHVLDAAAFEALSLDPALAAVLPALQPIVGLESPSRPQLIARIDAAITAVANEAIQTEIVAAADAASEAAEEVEPNLDLPAIPVPPERVLAPRTEFAITDPSLLLLRAEVPDPELFDAISNTEYEQVGGRPVVRARVLEALQPIAESRIEAATSASLAAVEAAVDTRYRLIAPVIDELALEPEFAAVSPDLVERLGGFEGVAYPSERLYEQALESIAPPLGPTARAALEDVGRKSVDPAQRRTVAPIAADCGCVANRYAFDSLVYGFYPFWQFAESGADPAAMPTVDFELIERIAFDGIEIGEDAKLRYEPRWNEAAATFTVSAHRHQARVDLAIRVRDGWRDWSAPEIEDAAFAVIEELTRSRRGDPLVTSGGIFGWLDRYVDRRPDGVTLIVDGYTGVPGEDGARNLVALVRAIGEGLEGTGKAINLAFDIPLVGVSGPRDPLFRDLREVILETDPLRQKSVEHVIVFVERPTAEAKKLLRARLENTFSGEDRWTVLRHVIPVVPAAGNAAVSHEEAGLVLAAAAAEPFGQFHDDVLYFQDNFRGIGFWPAPAAGMVLTDGTADRLTEIVRLEFDEPALPEVLRPYEEQVGAVCTVVCPNRLAFYLGCVVAGASILAVRGLSLYSRRVRSLAEAVLLTPVMTLGLAVLLLLIVSCDRSAQVWAPVALAALLAAVVGLMLFEWYGRRLDGPVP